MAALSMNGGQGGVLGGGFQPTKGAINHKHAIVLVVLVVSFGVYCAVYRSSSTRCFYFKLLLELRYSGSILITPPRSERANSQQTVGKMLKIVNIFQ